MAAAAFNALLRVARQEEPTDPGGREPGRPVNPAPSKPAPSQPAPASRCPKPALLIAGHGTRDPEGVAAFTALTERVARRSGHAVAGGFIELSEPPLRDAVAGLVGQGQRSLVAVPLMLAAAGHSKGDVPAALARESARHPGLSIRYGRPLGPHPVLLDLLAARVGAVRAGMAGPPAVLVTGRGTTDPDGNADVVKVARLLWEGRDYEFTDTAFISLARPSVPEGLERCRRLGAQRIVVARYFLFPGVLPDRVTSRPPPSPPPTRSWTCAPPTCSGTATRSPGWSPSGTPRRWPATSG